MSRRYIPRALEPVLRKAAAEFAALVLTGPRQSGKTTLLKHVFGAASGYVSLEPPDVRAAAEADPRGFLRMHPPPVIFDEVQYAPTLLPYIKERIDEHRHVRGQYLLTGSQNLLLTQQITESLAGRAAMLRLLPLSQREESGRLLDPLPWEPRRKHPAASHAAPAHLWRSLLRGGYPELVANPARDISLWQSSYVQTYLERDVRSLRQVGDLISFQNFLRALAARSGQLLGLTDLGRDLGVTLNTVKAWLSVLEATFQVIVLRPYFENVGKRMVKTPKVYFTDTGTLCYLAGLKDPDHGAAGPLGGAIFETAVLLEIVKAFVNRGEEPQIYFWRTSAGVEVDLVVATGGRLIPIEVKLSATPRPAMANAIRTFQEDFGDSAGPGYVIHPGNVVLPLAPKVVALPFSVL
ncbi:MAG TPA: ATP-binding protein [Bryobacteraceae bacterium]|nr:ATP-binding protein [Bryobacteraceae bacterium]